MARAGTRISWESFGYGPTTILLLPTWSVLHAAHGRFQIADLARDHRVVAFDPRGNGGSDRPVGPAAYADTEFVADALAVLDASGTDRAVVVGCSAATYWLLGLAGDHPDRVLGAVASGTNLPFAPALRVNDPDVVPFDAPNRSTTGWAKWNAAYWREHYEDFLRFFFSQVWTEPHSDAVIEDAVTWGLETSPETLIDTVTAPGLGTAEVRALAGRVECPVLVIHGRDDAVTPMTRSVGLAAATGGRLELLEGSGHCPGNRDPVRFDRLIRDFVRDDVEGRSPVARVARSGGGTARVLFVPAPDPATIVRDSAIAEELSALRPGVEVEWLVSREVRSLLDDGAAIHPASRHLLGEAPAHLMGRGYDAWRRQDEARFADFMVFADLVAEDPPDLVVADDAWHVDHYLHEVPELKRFAYAWLTTSVGRGSPDGLEPLEERLRVDAESAMVDLVARQPKVRDRAVLLGGLGVVPAGPLGTDVPDGRAWAEAHLRPVRPDPLGRHAGDVREVAAIVAELA